MRELQAFVKGFLNKSPAELIQELGLKPHMYAIDYDLYTIPVKKVMRVTGGFFNSAEWKEEYKRLIHVPTGDRIIDYEFLPR